MSDSSIRKIFRDHYAGDIQLSPGQIQTILGVIAAAGEQFKLLVFGCGNDSALWASADGRGKTVFLEADREWMDRVKEKHPALDVRLIDYGARTVAESLPIDEAALAAIAMPEVMTEEVWDVIVVDAPPGHKPHTPGRSLPIFWSSRVATVWTHVFVDDYERKVERAYADRFLNATRIWNATIPRTFKDGHPSNGQMLWSMGIGLKTPNRVARPRRDRGAVIFLLDSKYLPGLRTMAYTLRHALEERSHDVVILSNDGKIGDDPLIARIADRVIVFSDEELESLSAVDASKVHKSQKLPTIGKYNFLKFLSFRDLGYSHHLFLDVDMICLREDFSFNELVRDCDFAAAPTMGKHFLRVTGGKQPADIDALLKRIRKLMAGRSTLARSFNSGVFFARNSILGDEWVEQVLEVGSEHASPLEQEITQRFIASIAGLKFESLSAGYNFSQTAAEVIGEDRLRALGKDITFLHYNKPGKPWLAPDGADWQHRLWLEVSREAEAWAGRPQGSSGKLTRFKRWWRAR